MISALCCLALAVGQSVPEKLIAAGHWKQARTIVEARIRENPQDPQANYLLSQIRNAFHDYKSPLALAEKAVALDGSNPNYHRQLAEVLGVTAQHASMFQQLFLARRFKKEIDRALELDPRDLQAQRDLMEFYLLAPGIAGGDRNKARAVAEQITRLDPAEGWLAQARLAQFHKELGKMEEAYRKAVEAVPSKYRARITLADFYLSGGRTQFDSALQHAREAVRIDPGRVDAYVILAAVYASLANWPELERVLAEAQQKVPDDLTPGYRAADVLLSADRDLPRAEHLLRQYLGAEPEGNQPTLADAQHKLDLVLRKQQSSRGTTGQP